MIQKTNNRLYIVYDYGEEKEEYKRDRVRVKSTY